MFGYIYKVTNVINNKVYIGQTTDTLEKRWKRHINSAKKGSNLYFHRALIKYNINNFKIENIDQAQSKKELNDKEKYWIAYYKSYVKDFGYNLTKGGEGGALTGEALEKMKLSKKGKKPSPESILKRSISLKGKLCGEKNPMYGKKPVNANKTMEEFFGKERAEYIKDKIRKSTKLAMQKSEKYQNYLKKFENNYYNHPKHCKYCGKIIKYKAGYISCICDNCKKERKKND